VTRRYRAVLSLETHGERYTVQVWRWWLWPHWAFVTTAYTLSNAREYAQNHANKRKTPKRIIPLTVGNEP